MAWKKTTMQEIADACGLSRNTVSKVFNGRGAVLDSTRQQVLAKARELGYFQNAADRPSENNYSGNIALLTHQKLLTHHFGAGFFTSFTNHISRSGFTMQIYKVSSAEIAEKRLPPRLDPAQTAGILGIELFDKEYLDMICALGKPTVFVDGYPRAMEDLLSCDIVSMENVASETILVNRMIAAGAKRIGFVGDIEHCNSFYERWTGFCSAMNGAGLPVDRRFCILKEDSKLYENTEWLLEQLASMPEIPDAFACANDYLAIHLMTALKKKGLSIPKDVMVTGFDGSPEAEIIDPTLTTARIPGEDIGRISALLLKERITKPDFPYHWTYVKTTPVWGKSIRYPAL